MGDFDPQRCLELLVDGYKNGNFTPVLRRHLTNFVPAVFKNLAEPDPAAETRLCQKLIFSLFDRFVCNGEPTDVYQELKKSEPPSLLCAKEFKLGEPTYSCRDCGMDPTCVLCIECFQNSAHKMHKYKMSTSSGGGYCDCGDPEAWKSDPFCDVHKSEHVHEYDKGSTNDPLSSEMRERFGVFFYSITEYILDILIWPNPLILPPDLQCSSTSQTNFVTMLFNDEVHTYEQVTTALVKAINCSQTTAIDLATTVDREGRSVVKIGTSQECEHVKRVIEQATSRRLYNLGSDNVPLVVKIMSPQVVAHQLFALKAVAWLKQLLGNYSVLRDLYAEMSLRLKSVSDGMTFVERCMLHEVEMWKSARIQTRQLFMTGIFMNPQLKREFSIIYTKVYDKVMKEHVSDDHEHSYSVASESVQIFTVPSMHYKVLARSFVGEDTHLRKISHVKLSTQIFPVFSLARMLITDHDLLKVILDSLLSECEKRVNDKGVMSFEGQESNARFIRCYYVIYDLKYALLLRPEPNEWTEELRVNFLSGFKSFLEILKLMQGMDANLRQVDNHIEYEQEWETGFNFQLKLVEVYSLFVEWCNSDEAVLVKAIKMCIETLKSLANPLRSVESVSICGLSSECFRFDFTMDHVSIHCPLTRILASLVACHNRIIGPQMAEFFSGLSELEETSVKELLEPCLRAVVFVAQVNAGMWRRNGFSLQSQVYFYHNIKCRSSMFDKDVLFLQVAASILPSDDFLLQLLHSFALVNWSNGCRRSQAGIQRSLKICTGRRAVFVLRQNLCSLASRIRLTIYRTEYDTESTPDDSMKQVISLAETFLNWIITIYCERYVVGVGEVTLSDIQKYEVVHSLCIQPMSHSELLESILHSANSEKEKCLEELVKEVATFKKPTSSLGKGVYELKEEYYSMYNPHFYHYTKSNRAKSEENIKKYLKRTGNSTAVRPPTNPLPEFVGMFRNIPQLLHCDVFIHIARLVLSRSTARWSKSWSEMQLEKVLFLLEYALNEEQKRVDSGDLSYDLIKKVTDASSPPSIYQILENLLSQATFSQNPIRELILTVYERIREMAGRDGNSKMEESSSGIYTVAKDSKKNQKVACDKAKKRREKIMAQMAKMQRNFIKENQELFESTSTMNAFLENNMDECSVDESAIQECDVVMTQPVALGLHRSAGVASVCRQTCILCQEDQDVMHNDKALVYCCYMQKSTVLSTDRSTPLGFKISSDVDPLFSGAHLPYGIHTGICGHVMHADCWKSFFDALVQRESRRTRIRVPPHTSFDVSKKEFLCPMCESISNAVLPLISPLSMVASKESDDKNVNLSVDEWLDGILKTVENSIKQEMDRESREDSFFFVPCPLSTVTKMMAEGVAQRFQYIFDYMVDFNSSTFSDSIVEMLKKFAGDVFEVSLDSFADLDDNRVPVTLWNTCTYTILTAENSLRYEDKALFGSLPSKQAECIGTLIRLSAVASNFFPVELIKKHCIRLLSVLLCHSINANDPDLLNLDLFHALVSICFSLPTLYRDGSGSSCDTAKNIVVPTGHVNESNLLQLTLACHLLQIFLSIEVQRDAEETKEEMIDEPMETELGSSGEELLKICQHFRSLVGLPASMMNAPELETYVKRSCLPFLRCAALFFHYLTGVPAPLKLFQKNEDEIEIICEYLDLPRDFSNLFHKSKLLQDLLTGWCRELGRNKDTDDSLDVVFGNRFQWQSSQQSVNLNQKPTTSSASQPPANIDMKVKYPREVNQLLDLPKNYSDLINRSSMFSCPKSNSSEESRTPALCLICGTTVCSQSYCCQVKLGNSRNIIGAAMAHAIACGGGTGIFLRVRDCQVMLLSGLDKGCFMPSPYLDEYGETDEGLRRGNPLTLCKERYRHLQKMWLNHLIAGEVAHRIENPAHVQAVMAAMDFNHL